jgi:hypothetical protein
MEKYRVAHWFVLLVIASLALGCSGRALVAPEEPPALVETYGLDSAKQNVTEEAERGERPAVGAGMPTGAEIERKIIYNVAMHLIVKDTDEAFAEIQRLAKEVGGFVSESNAWREDSFRRGTITIRVPVGELEDLLAQLRALALDVESENIDSQDVTEEYVDLEARLTNERRTEAELLELLASRSETGRTQDILDVHRELSNVRSQIERIEGRMRYLENLSDMATVRITVTPDALLQPIDVAGWRPQGTARDAVRMLLRTMQFFADAAIVFFLYILPTLVVIAIPVAGIILAVRAVWQRVRRRRGRTAAAD